MDVSHLKTGDRHYKAYVGPAGQYDLMGATQFRLLCSLGLRARHAVLDVGCGSLRAGRLLISYLDEGCYFGIEPNGWLIDDAVAKEIGHDQIRIKKPRFDHNADFDLAVFGRTFDFILAQSVFSHAGRDLIVRALANLRTALAPDGLAAVTFIEGRDDFEGGGWVYPECVAYRRATIGRFAADAGLEILRIPWFHPRQTWYLLARNRNRLPGRSVLRHLSGAVLFEPEFEASWKGR